MGFTVFAIIMGTFPLVLVGGIFWLFFKRMQKAKKQGEQLMGDLKEIADAARKINRAGK